ncbi:MAG: ATP-binding protein, partial [Blastocatellia bacterium]
LNHPNIVTIYDIGESEFGHYIAMEFVQGQTLKSMYADSISLALIAKVGAQVAEALAVAHAANIVHRDIKPDNIMLRDDGYVKVLDFGLARLIPTEESESSTDDKTQTALTGANVMLGTPRYMSPEQAGGNVVESQSDVFSLGILLYELTTGTHPFPSATQIGFLQSVNSQQALLPTLLNPEISANLESLLLRMLEKSQWLRPTAAEVAEALKQTEAVAVDGGAHFNITSSGHRLVGREKELKEIRAWFDSATTNGGLLVGIAGEPGLGKTSLAENFLANLKNNDQACGIGRGRCSERLAGANAYLPFLESLEKLLHDNSLPYARLMKTLAPTWYAQIATLQPANLSDMRVLNDIKAVSQERLKRELLVFLQEASRQLPLVLFLDDLHWADESTTDLLAYLGGHFRELRMLILAAYRLSELALGAHPFQQVKLELQGHGLCHELQPSFWSSGEIETYLLQEFPVHRFPPEFADMVFRRTEGNPLFVNDLVRYLRDREIITEAQGQWTLVQEVETIQNDLPESVRSMVQRKIALLEDSDLRLLVAGSVQGYEFDAAIIAQALNLDAADVEDRLDELEHAYGLVRMVGEKEFPDRTLTIRYQFVHALYQNALYALLKPARRASISKAIAQSLIGFHRDKLAPIATRLAALFETARGFDAAVEYYVIAAKHSMNVAAFKESLALARRGLELLKDLPENDDRSRKEMALQHVIAGSMVALKSPAAPEALPAFLRARELAARLGEQRTQFRIEYSLVWTYFSRCEADQALAQADAVIELANQLQDSLFMVQANYVKGCLAGRRGQLSLAREQFELAISLTDADQPVSGAYLFESDGTSHSHSQLARILWLMGYPDQALAQLDKAFELAERNPHPIAQSHVLVDSFSVYSHYDQPQLTLELTDRMITLCQEKGLALVVYAYCARGKALVGLGRQQEGVAILRNSVNTLRAMKMVLTMPSVAVAFADVLIQTGQAEEAISVIDESLAIIAQIGETTPEAELHRLKGEALRVLAGQENDPAPAQAKEVEAENCFRQAIAIARAQGAKSFELSAAISLYRLALKQDQPGEVRQLLSKIYLSFTEGFDTPDLKLAKSYLDLPHGDNDDEPPTKRLQSLDGRTSG